MLVSLSKDGEYIARALPKFNMIASRGSTTRGGAAAYRGLISKAKLGYSLALTPDGPRGPIYQASQGVLALARKTGLPIIPVGVYATSKFSVNSWDKFQVILPFGKCSIVLGKSLTVKKEDNLKELSKELTLRIQDATSKAAKLCGVK
ncbi:MAG: lysophospholipid acyltransferase family protein [Elusimicrobiaceae bacterium]|nr:lysophospholipid acyltransferase family protein [Elusimicrobiaceae bacterium]